MCSIILDTFVHLKLKIVYYILLMHISIMQYRYVVIDPRLYCFCYPMMRRYGAHEMIVHMWRSTQFNHHVLRDVSCSLYALYVGNV